MSTVHQVVCEAQDTARLQKQESLSFPGLDDFPDLTNDAATAETL